MLKICLDNFKKSSKIISTRIHLQTSFPIKGVGKVHIVHVRNEDRNVVDETNIFLFYLDLNLFLSIYFNIFLWFLCFFSFFCVGARGIFVLLDNHLGC